MVSIKNISQKSFVLLLMVFSAVIVDTEAYNIHSYSKKCRVGLSEAQKACTVCKWYNISRESLPMRIQHVCFHLHKNQCCSQIKNQYLNWLRCLNWLMAGNNKIDIQLVVLDKLCQIRNAHYLIINFQRTQPPLRSLFVLIIFIRSAHWPNSRLYLQNEKALSPLPSEHPHIRL